MISWIDAATSLISIGYEYIDASKSVGESLGSIVSALIGIADDLDFLSFQLDRLIEQVKRASEEIQGHLDRAFLKNALASVTSAAQNLISFMDNEATFKANEAAVERNLLKLSSALVRVQKYTDGVGVLALCGSGYALWAQAHTNLMRLRPVGTRVWAWEHPMHRHFIPVFKDVLTEMSHIADKYRSELATISLPEVGWASTYIESKQSFTRTAKYEDPMPQFWQLYSLTDTLEAGGKLLATGPTGGPRTNGEWRQADGRGPFFDEAEVRRSLPLFEKRSAHYFKMKNHIELSQGALQARDAIAKACETRPLAWPMN